MVFDSDFRLDGLSKMVMTPTEMTETFEGRDDFLYYRHVVLDPQIQNTDGDPTFFLDGQLLVRSHTQEGMKSTTIFCAIKMIGVEKGTTQLHAFVCAFATENCGAFP